MDTKIIFLFNLKKIKTFYSRYTFYSFYIIIKKSRPITLITTFYQSAYNLVYDKNIIKLLAFTILRKQYFIFYANYTSSSL